MRILKKLASALLALVMAFGLTCTAFATSPTTYTITIDNDVDGYQYTAYQIFKGDLSEYNGEAVLTNVSWNDDINIYNDDLYIALAAIQDPDTGAYPFQSNGTYINNPADIAAALAAYNDNSAVAQAFAEVVYSYLNTSSGTSGTSSPYTITVNEPGYYLIKTTAIPDGGAYTRYILVMTEGVTTSAEDKPDVPTVDKAVSDLDVNIGDTVTYYLAATLPTKYTDYSTYQLNFYDTLSKGLTYDENSITVQVFDSKSDYEKYLAYKGAEGVDSSVTAATSDTGTTVASGYNVSTGASGSDTTITISIADTNALKDGDGNTITVTKDSIIAVEFTATLNSSAVIASTGNPNEVYLKYSNNPYNLSDTGTTVTDIVYTWTYELEIIKTDATDDSPLEGAVFKLFRKDEHQDNEYAIIDSTTGAITWTYNKADATELTSGSDGKITVTGLDQGTYYMEEITAPTGYSLLAGSPTEIEITATYTQATDTDLTVDYTSLTGLAYELWDGTGTYQGKTDCTATGVVSVTIENSRGVALPATGGIGTTIFYVVGGVLVVGALVLLITRRRMGG